ncbi:MAG: zinc-finger domain-containing protein [Alphaproteobacteria bacterium]|nr:zinc-finger domain-containing protein [Alphaproteobacteria bacterium]
MQVTETITVNSTEVACDGGTGPLGHPKVYLNMQSHGKIDCPYCGRHFILAEGAKASSH